MDAAIKSVFEIDKEELNSNPVECEALRDLFWSDGRQKHLHAPAGMRGKIYSRSERHDKKHTIALFVEFENGEHRQCFGDDLVDGIGLVG